MQENHAWTYFETETVKYADEKRVKVQSNITVNWQLSVVENKFERVFIGPKSGYNNDDLCCYDLVIMGYMMMFIMWWIWSKW